MTTGLYRLHQEHIINLNGRGTYHTVVKPPIFKTSILQSPQLLKSYKQLTLTHLPTTSDISAYVVKHTQIIFKLRNVMLTKTWELQIWVPVQEGQCVIGTATESLITS
jgi:hypothetical protein